VGRDSSVDIATRYRLDGPGTESRWANKVTTEENTVLPADRQGAFLKVSKGCPKAYGNVSRSRSVGQNQDHVIWIRNACLVMVQCYS
jgi:hypothetical protein